MNVSAPKRDTLDVDVDAEEELVSATLSSMSIMATTSESSEDVEEDESEQEVLGVVEAGGSRGTKWAGYGRIGWWKEGNDTRLGGEQ